MLVLQQARNEASQRPSAVVIVSAAIDAVAAISMGWIALPRRFCPCLSSWNKVHYPPLSSIRRKSPSSGGVRVRSRVRFQAVKVSIFGGFQVESPTNKATGLKALLTGISLSEYGSEGFRVRLTRLSEYGSGACLVEKPTRKTQAEQYSDTVLHQNYRKNCSGI